MATDKKSRFTPGEKIDDDELIIKNRISDIRKDEKPARGSGKKTILLVSIIAVAAVLAAVLLITFFYKKPGSFLSSLGQEKKETPIQDIEKGITGVSENIHIQRGRDSYSKKYYNDAVAEFNEVVESDASDKDKAIALTYLGMISDDRGDYDGAVEYYKRALVYDKNNAEIYKNMSLSYRHKKDYGKAIEYAEKALDLNEKDINTRILLGNIYYEMNRYKDAAKQYSEALKLEPENASLLYNLGEALLKDGDEFAAMEYFKKAGASDKIGSIAYKAYARLGIIYTERRLFDQAEKYLKQAIALNPRDPITRYNLGIAYLRQEKKKEALQEFIAAEELSQNDNVMLENIGEAFFSLKDYNRSLSAYEKVLKTAQRNIRILSRIGEIYYGMGDLDKAFDAYKKITLIEPATENARIAYLNMGNILDDAQKYDEAIEAYQKALTINDKDDSAYYNLGIAYKHADRPELAIEAWRKATQLNDRDPKARMAVADYYYEKKIYDLAEQQYRDIITIWPGIQEAHFKIGMIYYKREQLEYALRAFNRVIEINGNDDTARKAYINAAVIMTKLKDDDETVKKSRALVQKALLIKPGDPEALFSMGIIQSKSGLHDRAIETFYQVIKGTDDATIISEAYNNIGKSYYKKEMYKKAIRAFTRGVEEDPSNEEIRLNRKVATQAYEAELAHENH